jgi:hypothetical protein
MAKAPAREDLYKQDWLGESLEVWLDKIEDTGLWSLQTGEEKVFGKRKVLIKCTSNEVLDHPSATGMKLNRLKYVLKLKNAEDIELCYENTIDPVDLEPGSIGGPEEKCCYFNDADNNKFPSHNFTWSKWERAFD